MMKAFTWLGQLLSVLVPLILVVVYAEGTYVKHTDLQAMDVTQTQDRINVINTIVAVYEGRGQPIPPELTAERKYWEDKIKNLRGGG